MRGIRFLILLVICAGLGGWIYFVESKRDPADTNAKDKVFTAESDKIDELVVKSESGDKTKIPAISPNTACRSRASKSRSRRAARNSTCRLAARRRRLPTSMPSSRIRNGCS